MLQKMPISIAFVVLDDQLVETIGEQALYDNVVGAVSILLAWMAMLSHLRVLFYVQIHPVTDTAAHMQRPRNNFAACCKGPSVRSVG